ncbi:hemolysin family protein [Teichococcus oryzae]|uniref:HlyC/CorC family transporter n=1 Tax=Teichococcus oryzae TaxID=1608942 RepID=A0A5B2TB20_9PROT|nr:hemolysin family protein [Pseudoroseomonas oryzae]KAA2211389.1 HlyC/CorC family transporter [Pseudoroseomonas oryzae]
MFEIAVVLLLVVINGVFSLSELAVVSARRPRLRAMAAEGRPGAAAALKLAEDPGRFLSTVQIGITLVGVLAGAFSGSALGGMLSATLLKAGMPANIANPLGFGAVVAVVTYLSIVVGELVPKRLALRNPEGLACLMAPLMRLVSRIAAPAVWLLDTSTTAIFRLLGQGGASEERVTEDDVHSLVAEAEQSGAIEETEREMITGVLRLGDRPVRGIMTPRSDVHWIDLLAPEEETRALLMRTQHSRLAVGEGTVDALIGVVQTRELLAAYLAGQAFDVRAATRPAPVIPDAADALDALDVLRQAEVPVALVHDEYGHFEGIVTPADLLEAITGSFRANEDANEPGAVERDDGTWLLPGWLPADEMADRLRIRLPENRSFHTVAGFLLAAFGRIPSVGEARNILGWRFEVMDLDGRRIDKVLAAPAAAAAVPVPGRPGRGTMA